jgi:hypothetical protein
LCALSVPRWGVTYLVSTSALCASVRVRCGRRPLLSPVGRWCVGCEERGGGGGAGVCSVSLVVVAALVLGRLSSGAGVRSARVVSLVSVGGPPMSDTVAGSVACAIVLMRWVRRLELHCIVDVSGRTTWGMCCMMARRMCVPHSVPPGCCSVLAWMVRHGPFVCGAQPGL